MFMKSVAELECVGQPDRASVLLQPLRLRILELARQPASASDIAGQLRIPRQKVNYHVRELARAKFLRRAGQRKKRNMIERRYVATARAYVLEPAMLGPVQAGLRSVADTFSAMHLLALMTQAQSDLIADIHGAAAEKKRLATLSIASEIRFASASQREEFTVALRGAIADTIARFTSPAKLNDGTPGPGRPYRLMLGCYPIPKENANAESA